MREMDVEHKYGIDARRSVCVSGLADTDTDNDLMASFATYGVVDNLVRVRGSDEQVGNAAIVEFESENTRDMLETEIPFEMQNGNDPTVKWQVTNVNVLAQLPEPNSDSDVASPSSTDDNDSTPPIRSTTPLIRKPTKKPDQKGGVMSPLAKQPCKKNTQVSVKRKALTAKSLTFSGEVTNPPEVQRLVVEHVITCDM